MASLDCRERLWTLLSLGKLQCPRTVVASVSGLQRLVVLEQSTTSLDRYERSLDRTGVPGRACRAARNGAQDGCCPGTQKHKYCTYLYCITNYNLQHQGKKQLTMSFFTKKREELNAWELPWALVWPNDAWLQSMLSKGLVPVLAGVDVVTVAMNKMEKEELDIMLREEGARYVLGLVRASEDTPKKFADALGSNVVKELESSLRSGFTFDSTKSMFSLEGEDGNVKVYIGFHKNTFWPKEVEDYHPFVAPVADKMSTGLVYYPDEKREIHQCPELLMAEDGGGFVADLPAELCGTHDSAWCVFQKPLE